MEEQKMKKTIILGGLALLLIGLAATGALAMPFEKMFKGRQIQENAELCQIGELENCEENFEGYQRKTLLSNNYNEQKQEMKNQKLEIGGKMKETISEQKELMAQAIENRDYTAWKELIENSRMMKRISESITEENFGIYAEMINAVKNNDIESVNLFREQLGLENCHSLDSERMMERMDKENNPNRNPELMQKQNKFSMKKQMQLQTQQIE